MMNKLSNSTGAFIKAVVNPIMAEESCLVPDLEQADSLCLTDYIEQTRPQNLAIGAASGLLVGLRCHESPIYTQPASFPGGGLRVYSLVYFWVDSTGVVDPNVGVLYNEITPANLSGIQGGIPLTNTGLVTGMRIFSMGLRVLPTIETVTDTTVTYVSRYIGGQVSMQEIGSWITNSTNIETIIRNSTCAETYANSEGCCVRYNPFQNEIQLRTQGIDDCLNSAQSFAYHKMPFIYMRFSSPIAVNDTAPCIFHARFWIHGILRKPSPIYAQQSKADTNYPLIRTVMSGCHPEFPLVTKGHSFPVLAGVVMKALRVINQATGIALNVANADLRPLFNGQMSRGRGRGPRRKVNRRPRTYRVRNGNGNGNGRVVIAGQRVRGKQMPPNPRNVKG